MPAAPQVEENPKPKPPPPAEPKKRDFAMREPVLVPPREEPRAPGEKFETGDPYLNALYARIERNRAPTSPVGPSGLHLEGITVYEIALARDGRMLGIELLSSSGSPALDAEARRMIVAATPFPPPPRDYPDRTMLRVTIHLFPQ